MKFTHIFAFCTLAMVAVNCSQVTASTEKKPIDLKALLEAVRQLRQILRAVFRDRIVSVGDQAQEEGKLGFAMVMGDDASVMAMGDGAGVMTMGSRGGAMPMGSLDQQVSKVINTMSINREAFQVLDSVVKTVINVADTNKVMTMNNAAMGAARTRPRRLRQ